MNVKKNLFKLCSAVLLGTLVCSMMMAGPADAKDKIVIGASRSLSGPLAFFEENAFGPLYKMWVKQINDKGGLYVKEYDKSKFRRHIFYKCWQDLIYLDCASKEGNKS